MKKKRVIHIVSSLSISNGIINVVLNYYRNMDRDRIQFDFIYFFDSEESYKSEIENLGGEVYKLHPPNLKSFINKNEYMKEFDVIKNKYLIAHIHEVVLLSFLAPLLRKQGIKTIISHSHSTVYSFHPLKALRNYILSLRLKQEADIYLTCSQASGEFWYGSKLMNEGRVKQINNAIDIESFRYDKELRNRLLKKFDMEDTFVLGNVGRFSLEKNHDLLIDIFAELQTLKPESRLLLIGSGPLERKIKEKVNNLGLSNKVLFLGQKSNVYDYYQMMDVFVFPSRKEGLGTVAIEAQASGLPCIVSDTLSKEIDVCSVTFVSLEKKPSEWAKIITELKNDIVREKESEKIKSYGYSIVDESIKLMDFYERLLV